MTRNLTLFLFVTMPVLAQYAGPTSPSLTVGEKFKYHGMKVVEPAAFLRSAVAAGFDQLRDSPHEWGQGAEGYGRRYASSFGTNIVRHTIGFGLDAALHTDPRFFKSEKTGFGPSLNSGLAQTCVGRQVGRGHSLAVAE